MERILKLAKQEAGRRMRTGIVLAAALLADSLVWEAQAGPIITLTYYGDLNGSPATAVIQFEDLRLPTGSVNWGFYNIGGHLGWKRVEPLAGRMYVSGYINSQAAFYNLSGGSINGIANWGYLTIDDPNDGYPSFIGEMDVLPYDADFVYMDRFALIPNPLDPPQPTYVFQLAAVATPTISPNGGSFSGSLPVSLACATAGATIYYTTNGTTPTAASPVYGAPFTLTASVTVKAMATGVGLGLIPSATVSATFTVTPSAPLLSVTRSGNSVTVSWPSPSAGFVLQKNSDPANPNSWANYGTAPSDNGTTKSVTLNLPTGNLFFRLKK